MGPPSTAPDYSSAKDAKDLLDMIGKDVHDQVEKEAAGRGGSELKGLLSLAKGSGVELAAFPEPCGLIKDKGDELLGDSGERHPCGNTTGKEDVDRFSVKQQAEYDNKKMKCSYGSNGTDVGACAPYRRLFLCNKNMEKMGRTSTTKHDLLLDVCMAANYEAQDQLESKLKKIFGDIYNELTNGRNGVKDHYQDDNGGNYFQLREDWWTANRATVWKAITCKADTGNAYFRPTCSNRQGPSQAHHYCRCNGDKPDDDKPNTDPPTYFDYVPQYLRWFEEWAEDFCRKKKIYVGIVKTYCREKYKSGNEPRYCSRNGYDCTKTKRAIGKYRMGNQCISCLYACNPYVDWINNQKEQFDKQKQKYDKEIKIYKNGASGIRRQKRGTTTKYEGYEKKFYDKLEKNNYGTVGEFLGLLNNEKACKEVKDGGTIDFKQVNSTSGGTAVSASGASSTSGGSGAASGGTSDTSGTNNASQGTFYRSEYCQPCPHCGVRKANNGNFVKKSDSEQCKNINLYRPKKPEEGTKIEILKSGEGETEIKEKLEQFCQTQNATGGVANGSGSGTSGSQKLYEDWKCYNDVEKDGQDGVDDDDDLEYDRLVNSSGGLCILQKKNGEENGKKQKTYNDFFNFWVAHMLKDSIHWRTKKIKGCLKNGKAIKCTDKCKGDCKCFERWVEQKREEWTNIKEHFGKQTDIPTGLTPDALLEGVLEKGVLLTSIKEAYGDAKETEHIKQLLDETAVAGGVVVGAKDNTTIDKLLEQELKDANRCKNCEQRKPPGEEGGAARNLPGVDTTVDDANEDDLDDEDDEDEDDDGGGSDVGGSDVGEVEEETAKEATEETTTPLDVCNTVKTALEGDLGEACRQKYEYGREKFPNWKCISGDNTRGSESESAGPSRSKRHTESSDSAVTATGSSGEATGKSGDKDGAICVPPRRRKLYLGGFKRLTDGTAVSSEATQAGTPSQSPKGDALLLTAFVETAAVETFFLWHKYKQEKKKPKNEVGGAAGVLQTIGGTLENSGEQNPQKKLQESGEIPDDFLRQMFYTLGDYRDILVRGVADDKNGGNNIILNASGNKEDMEKMKKIQQEIDKILEKSGSEAASGAQKNSGISREKWWDKHAPSIWDGMVCALTYNTDTASGTAPTQIQEVKNALLDGEGKKPKQNGTNGKDYTYGGVRLEDENSGTQALSPNAPASTASQTTQSSSTSENTPTTLTNPKLKDFVLRPTYFRYLEEWGQNFCKERKKRLDQIYRECKVDEDGPRDGKKCSGYGEDCKDNLSKKYDTLPSLECPGCGRHCSFYKKWIKIKKDEYEKQQKAYNEQRTNYTNKNKVSESNNHDKEFCTNLETKYTDAANFLQRLKDGPCKNNSEEDQKVNGYIKFDDISKDKTFGHENYCDPCSKFTVNCNRNDHCDNSNGNNCKDNKITAEKIGNGVDSTVLDMRVIDDSATGFKGDGLEEACGSANIFKGIRKEQWKCGKVCGYNVCKPKEGNRETVRGEKNDDKHIITIRALVTHWVQNFLEDYKKIKHKISHCTKTDQGSTCQNKCQNKCKCVGEWIKLKQQEWEEIKKRFLNQYKMDSDEYYPVRSVLETFLVQIGAANANNDVKKLIKLSEFYKSCGCSAKTNSENNKNEDAIDCMLDKLGKKAEKCHDQHSDNPQEKCDEPPPELDEEDLLLEEEQNPKNMRPGFCPQNDTTEQQEEEENICTPAETVKKEEEEKEEQEEEEPDEKVPPPRAPEASKPKKEKPSQPPRPRRTLELLDNPHVQTALVTSTLAWSVGIGFAAFTYFYLKVLYILRIDYDIPTLKSSNRYIPYASDRYKGKTYIYMEGDSSGDEKYAFMSDTTDVTSSESEYEELDINDIYVPGSPKYKTLIEVVLEPSGNNTPTSDIPSDNTPTPQPITDDEWNQLKKDFISNMLQNTQNTEPNILHDNVDNNTHPTMSRHNMDQKPFIMSIHDRNLFSGEEYNYDMFNSGNNPINISDSTNSMDSLTSNNHSPYNDKNDLYSGIDLINDALSGNHIDIYDEMLKRKENELFGTQHHPKNITSNRVVTQTSSDDPITNQINLFHKWLDRHRDMCEKWKNNHERLPKLKELWENETHSGDINSGIPSGNHVLNTDVSIQIDMDNPKTMNEFTNMDTNPDKSTMDTILDDLEKYNEPYYYDFYKHDIYYDVNDDKASEDHINMDHNKMDNNNSDVPTKVQIEMNVINNQELLQNEYPISHM
ncbi:hypothetical protein PFNF54_00744 [Plasmodium falciparum NF54]|uniref:Erythrocyte membrane protein 1 n=1 Tax=Plasmodium falciparum (isolate NF54) TaxID=5843 RepID=W7KA11_PLAFO|nr:hypothetical protein PFNF54_00744 [Plasmodium falciparum NF54]